MCTACGAPRCTARCRLSELDASPPAPGSPRRGTVAPSLLATRSNARLRFPTRATSSIAIAGRGGLTLSSDFGTACRASLRGRPLLAPRTADSGLSAVSANNANCPACSLAVVAFPPRVAAVGTTFRPSSGTTRPSDPYRLVVIGSPNAYRPPAEAERSPWVRTKNFAPSPSPARTPDRRMWGSPPSAGSPTGRKPSRRFAFARFGAAPMTSTRRPLARTPVSLR
jgi:hypothetical protein